MNSLELLLSAKLKYSTDDIPWIGRRPYLPYHTMKRKNMQGAAGSSRKQHFEKRVSRSERSHSPDGDSRRAFKRQDSLDGPIEWFNMVSDWRRCETMWLSWSGGHGPFNINATSYPDNATGDASQALNWQIAYLVGNHNYQWTGELACY